jgi:16S rRNA (cytosine1402-N4)-methyltransferase
MSPTTVHVPVLLKEVLEWSGLSTAETDATSHPRLIVDGTLGGAGHAVELIHRLGQHDIFLGIDRDATAVERARSRLLESSCKVQLAVGSYIDLPELIEENSMPLADCILLDLGLSSDQLADDTRGFSFRLGGPLDLRFNTDEGISAADMLAKIDERELADIIFQYGEERFSRRIAKTIVERRRHTPIETANDLADLVHRSVPGRMHGRVDSATRTFQALRIAVNRELEHVAQAMKVLPNCLKPGGKLIVISFHSLEDRIVKHAMRESAQLSVSTKKPITASEDEMHRNARSRSAKLRVAVRCEV